MKSKNEKPFSIESISQTLQSLMEEDPLLAEFVHLHQTSTEDTSNSTNSDQIEPVFQYAAALISSKNKNMEESSSSSNTTKFYSGFQDIQDNANEALVDIDRKLNLVQNLVNQIAREKPEHVVAPLLRLHGYTPYSTGDEGKEHHDPAEPSISPSAHVNNYGLFSQTLERCERLGRQANVLDSVAERVESTLMKGLDRMSHSTLKLERVLQTSQVLKMIMRLQFEAKKVLGSGIDFDGLCNENIPDALSQVDLRDLTRAASSLAAMEELLRDPALSGPGVKIDVVENIRPVAVKVGRAVRKAAAGLLEYPHRGSDIPRLPSVNKLGATLEVYFHLNELPDAVWNIISSAVDKAEKASGHFLNPSAIKRLMETASSEATALADEESSSSKILDKKKRGAIYDRILKNKSRDLKAEVAHKWASSVSNIAQQVWQLHTVLRRKSDVVKRQNFLEIVLTTPIPDSFSRATELNGVETKTSIFSVFWNQMCINLGSRIKRLLNFENGTLATEVASFYPSMRAAALEILTSLQDTMQIGSTSSSVLQDEDENVFAGVLGGSSAIENDLLLNSNVNVALGSKVDEGNINSYRADSWTKNRLITESFDRIHKSSQTIYISSLSSIFTSKEWRVLTGCDDIGLFPIQRLFFISIRDRLRLSLKNLFLESTVVDENGIGIKMLPVLPSQKDLNVLEELFRLELSVADPREGGGEFSMAASISECIVETVEAICSLAKGALSGAPESRILNETSGTMTEDLDHDIKVAHVMASITESIRNLPDITFIAPYKPANTIQHEEAANMSQIALLPAIHELENFVKLHIIIPLCNAINSRLAKEIGKMHMGSYIETSSFSTDALASEYENLVKNILYHIPIEYSGVISTKICEFSIYYFITNATLIRPLVETGRLHITQALTDLELTLEQLLSKTGGNVSLSQIQMGKPYAELRAVRQMLFWNALDDRNATSDAISKSVFREVWSKDVRPSTICNFLLSFAPSILSSPHHASRMSAEDYALTLVKLNGSIDAGEGKSWVTILSCCESYRQRESISHSSIDGDRRIPSILLSIGPELLRRRKY